MSGDGHLARSGASLPRFGRSAFRVSRPGRRWPLRVSLLARLKAPWLDAALIGGADPSGSPELECRAALILSHVNRLRVAGALRRSREAAGYGGDPHDLRAPADRGEVEIARSLLVELEDALTPPEPVYCRGVAMASRIVSDGTGPLYAPRRRGELRERVAKVIAALRGAL